MDDDSPHPSDPPQHLLGGLNVAILALPGCRADHVVATKHSLEELGVNVQILSRAKGAVPRVAFLCVIRCSAAPLDQPYE